MVFPGLSVNLPTVHPPARSPARPLTDIPVYREGDEKTYRQTDRPEYRGEDEKVNTQTD
jgi:hypothetical protein